LQLTATRLSRTPAAPTGQRIAARVLLWRRRIIDYLLVRAVRP